VPWVRFDDNTPEDPKVDHLSDGAFRLWFAAICFSNRNLTDGFVPHARVVRLTPNFNRKHLDQLVEAGMFHKQADGITIHGYLSYQPSADEIRSQRDYERQKKRRQREQGFRKADRDPNSGRFMSPGDNHGDSPRESRRESPATHPTPPLSKESSSSEPLRDPPHEEEEDPYRTEAERRLATTTRAITDPNAWIAATTQRLRNEGWKPRTPRPAPTCRSCNDLPLDEPCPDCTPRSATA
jgi:hypothetical protein